MSLNLRIDTRMKSTLPIIVSVILALVTTLQGQQLTTNPAPNAVLRVCVDIDGSKVSRSYPDLINSLSDQARNKESALGGTISPVSLFGEERARCDYVLRLGPWETAYWNEGDYQLDQPHNARADVPIWIFRAGNDKAIAHKWVSAMWIESPGLTRSQAKLMAAVAQEALKAIEKDRRH